MDKMSEEARQRSAKLHCFGWDQPDSFLVDIGEGVVHDEAWPPFPLGDNTQG